MRAADPVSGMPEPNRYRGTGGRYDDLIGKGPAGHYESKPTTIEEEVNAGGWTPGAKPTGDDSTLNRLYTTGMRGEPGYDDDPSPAADGRGYAKTPAGMDVDAQSWD